jgi:hypothetical protein
MSPIAWPGIGLLESDVRRPLLTTLPLAGLPFTETMSSMIIIGSNVLMLALAGAGTVANLELSATSPKYTTPFSNSISKITI